MKYLGSEPLQLFGAQDRNFVRFDGDELGAFELVEITGDRFPGQPHPLGDLIVGEIRVLGKFLFLLGRIQNELGQSFLRSVERDPFDQVGKMAQSRSQDGV